MRTTLLTLLVVAMTLSLAPATALTPAGQIEPTFRTERVYFQCKGDTKLQNLTPVGSWSTTRPAAPFAGEAAGCVQAEPTARSNGPATLDTEWAGTFTGNLRSMRLTAHDLSHLGANPADGQLDFIVNVWVDGVQAVTELDVDTIAYEANSGVTHEFTIVIDGLKFGVEDGNGTITRDIRVQLRGREAYLLTWGASEVPSGIQFN